MKIAVIGAGNVGTAVARGAVNSGHSVTVTSRDPEHARAVADQVGGSTAANPADAARGADVIVLAIPYTAVPDVAAQLSDAAAGKVVVDPTNPIKADYGGLAVTGRSGAEELQERLPGAKVVKAFNTVFAANQSDGAADGTQLDGLYAGDDAHAKETVRELLSGIGFRPIDVGPLSQALALEHMAFVNIGLNAANGWPWQSGWNLVGPTG
jgi:8-hydroxy-5-deazaflavin:NADPH oxidoreductase